MIKLKLQKHENKSDEEFIYTLESGKEWMGLISGVEKAFKSFPYVFCKVSETNYDGLCSSLLSKIEVRQL